MGFHINDFKLKLFDEAKKQGFTDCELYFSAGKSFEVTIFEGEIAQYSNSSERGVSFRGTYNNKMGYAFSEKIDESVIAILITEAKQNAEIIEENEVDELYAGDGNYQKVNTFNNDLANVSVEEKIEFAKKMEQSAFEFDKQKVVGVDDCVLNYVEDEFYIANSLGLELNNRVNCLVAYVSSRANENGQMKLGTEFFISRDIKNFNLVRIGREASEKAVSYLGAGTVKSDSYLVALDNIVMADLLKTFLGIFYADKVQKGFSLLKGKLGEKIASDILHICDEPLLENGVTTTAFDMEGVTAYNKMVVENGVLKTFLHNLKTAKKDGIKSTGNGFKGSYKSSVQVAATNFYIKNGKVSLVDMFKQMGTGIYVTEVAGLHSGTNTISGDFSLAADGFFIENGKILKPIEQFTIAGNFFEVLNNVKQIGNDLRFTFPSSVSSVGAPSVLIDKVIKVSGGEA